MQKTSSGEIEVKMGNRSYSLHFDDDSPLGEMYDAVSEIKSYIIERINNGDLRIKKYEKEEK